MDSDNNYLSYLTTRSSLSKYYRNFYLYPKLNSNLNGKVLDVGCGIGDFLKFRKNTIGVDINEQIVNHCKKNGLNVYPFKDNKFPFNDSDFDGAILDNVIEHIENPSGLLNEIKRVLKNNATFIVGVPGIKGYDTDNDHKKFYDETTLTETLLQFGFVKKKSFHMPLFKSLWLSKRVRQYCIYVVFTNIK